MIIKALQNCVQPIKIVGCVLSLFTTLELAQMCVKFAGKKTTIKKIVPHAYKSLIYAGVKAENASPQPTITESKVDKKYVGKHSFVAIVMKKATTAAHALLSRPQNRIFRGEFLALPNRSLQRT